MQDPLLELPLFEKTKPLETKAKLLQQEKAFRWAMSIPWIPENESSLDSIRLQFGLSPMGMRLAIIDDYVKTVRNPRWLAHLLDDPSQTDLRTVKLGILESQDRVLTRMEKKKGTKSSKDNGGDFSLPAYA